MNIGISKVTLSLAICALPFTFIACGGDSTSVDPQDIVDDIALSSSEADDSSSSEEADSKSKSSSSKAKSSSSTDKEASSSSQDSSSSKDSSSSTNKESSSSNKESSSSESSSSTQSSSSQDSTKTESSSSQESSSSVNINVTASSFTDSRDGKTYKLVNIGGQVWMAENLQYGDSSLYVFNEAKVVCPEGFHLPTLKEFSKLIEYVGGADVAAKKLKSTSGWPNDSLGNWNGTDDYGFNAKPVESGDGAGTDENFWSSTRNSRDYPTGNFLKLDPHPKSEWFCQERENASASRACLVHGKPETKLSIRCLSNNEECGGKNIDNTKQFCQNGVAYDICRQRLYDGTKYECKNDTLYERSSGTVFKYSWFLLNPNKTYGTFKDERDGQIYKTIDIDGVVWFAENLNYASAGSLCPGNEEKYCDVYGRMYTMKQALEEDTIHLEKKQGICPKGTHLPFSPEYSLLWEKYSFEELFVGYAPFFEDDDHDGALSRLTNESGMSMLENGAYNRNYNSWDGINRQTRNIGSNFTHYHYYRWSGSGIQEFYMYPDDDNFGAIRCVVD